MENHKKVSLVGTVLFTVCSILVLDSFVSPAKPIKCSDVSGHGALLNTYAIELCGITKDTADPPGGTIYHDADGELTGYFSDCGEILGNIPVFEYTDEQYMSAFLSFQEETVSYGLTGIDSGGDSIAPRLYSQMEKEGKLDLRVNTNFFTSPPAECRARR